MKGMGGEKREVLSISDSKSFRGLWTKHAI